MAFTAGQFARRVLFALRDRLLADKAMDLIHQKATVTMVPPKKKDDEAKSETAE